MSAEPDNPMEKALRDYARKRREQPGVPETLHGATRRLLQAEAQRTHSPKKSSNPNDSRHLAWWFRWQGLASLGTAVAALCLGVIWWASHESGPRMELALQDSTRRELSEAPGAGALMESDKRLRQPQSSPRDSQSSLLTAPAAPPAPVEAPSPAPPSPSRISSAKSVADAVALNPKRAADLAKSPVAESREATQLAIDSRKSDAARTLAAPSAQALPLGLAQETRALGPSDALSESVPNQPAIQQTLFFRQVNATQAPAKSEGSRAKPASKDRKLVQPTDPSVLTEFRLQNSNGQVTILDRDGSEYRGFLGTAVATTAAPSADNLSASSAAVSQLNTDGNIYRFQVTGTNRSLKQKLVLDGQLRSVPIPHNAGSTARAFQQLNRTSLASKPSPGSLPEAFTWEIQSAVSVGTQRPVNLNAVQVPTNSTPPVTAPAGSPQ